MSAKATNLLDSAFFVTKCHDVGGILTACLDKPLFVERRNRNIPSHPRRPCNEVLPGTLNCRARGAQERWTSVVEFNPAPGRQTLICILNDSPGVIETRVDQAQMYVVKLVWSMKPRLFRVLLHETAIIWLVSIRLDA